MGKETGNDAQLAATLLAALNSTEKLPPHRYQQPREVVPGQVRQLLAYDDSSDSALVLVVAVDDHFGTAKVVSIHSPATDGTHRDLVVDRSVSGFPFDFILRSDGPATAWCVQLAGSPQVGTIDPRIVSLAATAPTLSNEQLAKESATADVSVGQLRPRLGDHLWWSIGRAAEKLARLTAECYEALISEPIADPAILPSLVLRGAESDKVAATAMGRALAKNVIEASQETWEALDEALSVTSARDQDTMRLLERHFLQQLLEETGETEEDETEEQLEEFLPSRDLPGVIAVDPLLQLLARSARAGNRSTRIWTAPHLWNRAGGVVHTVVNEHNHAVISEYQIEAEEILV